MTLHKTDKAYVRRLLAGDEAQFARFFDEHFARLYRFAAARLPSDAQATREVVHMALTKAIRNLHRYRGEAALYTWLCTICRNEIHDWLVRHRRYQAHIVLVEDRPDVQAAIASATDAHFDGPEASALRHERARRIQVALDQLPARYGNALEWKYIEGFSVREIGERLGLGTEAAQSLLARAKRAFRDVYGALAEPAMTPPRPQEPSP